MSRLRFAAALVLSFLTPIGVAAAAVAPSGPATSTGTGGAAASVETLATQAAIERWRRERGRRRRGGGRRAWSDRAVLVRRRRRRIHGHPHLQGQGHHDRRPRESPRPRCARTRSGRTARRSPSTPRATAACRPACRARPPPGARARQLRTWSLARALRPGIARGQRRLRRRPDVLRQTTPNITSSTTSPRRRRSTSTPTARRATSAPLQNPDLASTYRRTRRESKRSTAARRRRDAEQAQAPAGRRPPTTPGARA